MTEGLPPPTGLSLVFAAYGQGTQNYTCSSISNLYNTTGAFAKLYDVSGIFHDAPVYLSSILSASSPSGLVELGHHYFDANNTPTFDLGNQGLLKGSKVAEILAPDGANPGFAGTGAVPWLMLRGVNGSRDLDAVYRIDTSGGQAPFSCNEDDSSIQISYNAIYLFFR